MGEYKEGKTVGNEPLRNKILEEEISTEKKEKKWGVRFRVERYRAERRLK